MKTFIYGLFSPEDPDVIMYVGKANCPKERLRGHLCESAVSGRKLPVHCWIASLRKRELLPELVILEEVSLLDDPDAWEERETYWIAEWRKLNLKLKNATAGGKSFKGLAAESRERIRVANKGRKLSDAAKQKLSLAQKGVPKDPEVVRRRAATQRGSKRPTAGTNISAAYHNKSIEEKQRLAENISLRLKGRVVTEETKQKLSDFNIGKKLSDETRAKMSVAKRANPPCISEEGKQKLREYHLGKPKSAESKKKLSVINRWKIALSIGNTLPEEDMQYLATIREGFYLTLTAEDVCKCASRWRIKKERHSV